MLIKKFIFYLLVSIAITGCAKKISGFNPEKVEDLSVKLNQEFVLSFKCTLTSGYNWNLTHISDSTIIQFVDKKINRNQPGLLGGNEIENWNFKSLKKGKTSLKFYYLRSWEEKTPLDSMIYIIKVK